MVRPVLSSLSASLLSLSLSLLSFSSLSLSLSLWCVKITRQPGTRNGNAWLLSKAMLEEYFDMKNVEYDKAELSHRTHSSKSFWNHWQTHLPESCCCENGQHGSSLLSHHSLSRTPFLNLTTSHNNVHINAIGRKTLFCWYLCWSWWIHGIHHVAQTGNWRTGIWIHSEGWLWLAASRIRSRISLENLQGLPWRRWNRFVVFLPCCPVPYSDRHFAESSWISMFVHSSQSLRRYFFPRINWSLLIQFIPTCGNKLEISSFTRHSLRSSSRHWKGIFFSHIQLIFAHSNSILFPFRQQSKRKPASQIVSNLLEEVSSQVFQEEWMHTSPPQFFTIGMTRKQERSWMSFTSQPLQVPNSSWEKLLFLKKHVLHPARSSAVWLTLPFNTSTHSFTFLQLTWWLFVEGRRGQRRNGLSCWHSMDSRRPSSFVLHRLLIFIWLSLWDCKHK